MHRLRKETIFLLVMVAKLILELIIQQQAFFTNISEDFSDRVPCIFQVSEQKHPAAKQV